MQEYKRRKVLGGSVDGSGGIGNCIIGVLRIGDVRDALAVL